jgi:transcription initiation factor TFIIIB Brf1 subunit/transcription initiation factor TFIIB
VFDKLDNIYRPKPYKPKMLPQQAQSGENTSEPWADNLNMTLMCKDCKEYPPNLVEEFSSGDMVCASCGLVLGERVVDIRSEWRTFANDDQGNDDPSRVGDGPNVLLNGSQLSTTIAFGDGNARSRDLLRAQGKTGGNDKSTKSLLAAYKEIGAHCDAVNIPKNVSDTAKYLFKQVDDGKAFKGKSQDAIIAGCIFIACRQCNVPRTFREIFALTKVSKKDIGRVFKSLEAFFGKQNNAKQNAANGKLRRYAIFEPKLLTLISKGNFRHKKSSRILHQRTRSISVSAIAVNLVSSLNSSSKFRRDLLRKHLLLVTSQVVLHYPLQLPVSTWRLTCLASPSRQRRSRLWLVSVTERFVPLTSTCIRSVSA